MKLSLATSALFLAFSISTIDAISIQSSKVTRRATQLHSTTENVALVDLSAVDTMTFRELRKHCTERNLDPTGTTATLRRRLRNLCAEKADECLVDPFTMDVFGAEQENVRQS